jgi:uncharacterized protein YndB with AHSA1/START domain
MRTAIASDDYGVLVEPATLEIQRVLPGPIERVWAYLTDSELRRQWLASGPMELKRGAAFELVWRNDELTTPPGQRPADFGNEHRMQSEIIEVQAPNTLVFRWGESGEVCFELQAQGAHVLLTVTHRRIRDRDMLLMVGPGWHAHLDVLQARVSGLQAEPFWDAWLRLKSEYAARLAA